MLAGKKQKVIKVGAGISFSLCLTEDGKGGVTRRFIRLLQLITSSLGFWQCRKWATRKWQDWRAHRYWEQTCV